jgi:hypothetical protein
MYRDLIDWIRDNGGVIDPRQEVRRERPGDPSSVRKVYATAEIPENTVLCNVPWKIILAPEDPEEDDLCETVRITRRELDRYRQGTSTFAPYMRVLDHLGQHVTLPEGWSAEGKQLLRKVLGRDLPPPAVGSHLAWYQEECGGDLADEAGVKAALLVIGHRSNGFFTPDGDEKSQEVMMPFFDLYRCVASEENQVLASALLLFANCAFHDVLLLRVQSSRRKVLQYDANTDGCRPEHRNSSGADH